MSSPPVVWTIEPNNLCEVAKKPHVVASTESCFREKGASNYSLTWNIASKNRV